MRSTPSLTSARTTTDASPEPAPCPLCGSTECADELDADLNEALRSARL